jgi:tetratricopeptide (TPR) repeat protein
MIALVAALVVAATDAPLFSRNEPHLEAAIDAMEAGDPDLAIERAHEAVVDDDDERAIVEYDIGQALALRAENDAKAQAAAASTQAQPGQPPAPPPAPKLDDAVESFERAAALAKDKRIQSEAHLAVGNAHLIGQKLDDAIAAYRRALVALPGNERARRNLQRALMLKQAQPPPPPQDGDGEQDDKDKDKDKKDESQDGEQKDKKDAGSKDDPQSGDQDQQKKSDEKKDDSAADPADKKDDAGDKPEDKKDSESPKDGDDAQQKKQPAQAKPQKPSSKEEAKRLLRGLRSRERPLTPMEMRGADAQRPKNGKDW